MQGPAVGWDAGASCVRSSTGAAPPHSTQHRHTTRLPCANANQPGPASAPASAAHRPGARARLTCGGGPPLRRRAPPWAPCSRCSSSRECSTTSCPSRVRATSTYSTGGCERVLGGLAWCLRAVGQHAVKSATKAEGYTPAGTGRGIYTCWNRQTTEEARPGPARPRPAAAGQEACPAATPRHTGPLRRAPPGRPLPYLAAPPRCPRRARTPAAARRGRRIAATAPRAALAPLPRCPAQQPPDADRPHSTGS